MERTKETARDAKCFFMGVFPAGAALIGSRSAAFLVSAREVLERAREPSAVLHRARGAHRMRSDRASARWLGPHRPVHATESARARGADPHAPSPVQPARSSLPMALPRGPRARSELRAAACASRPAQSPTPRET